MNSSKVDVVSDAILILGSEVDLGKRLSCQKRQAGWLSCICAKSVWFGFEPYGSGLVNVA